MNHEIPIALILFGFSLLHWVTARQINRLRETLRQHGIFHDNDKPWEGP